MGGGIDERHIAVAGFTTRYLTSGRGLPLVLLHGDGESALDWTWTLPALAATHRVYAPDLPGAAERVTGLADYTPAGLARFVTAFLDTLGIERPVVVGNSLGGLAALRLALAAPGRVSALGLVASAGLGRAVHPLLLPVTLPGYGEWAIAWSATPLGATQRAWWRATFLFARSERIPAAWLAEQERLAHRPGFLAATLAARRTQLAPFGQREVVLGALPRLAMPVLVIWGERDLVFPPDQARAAVAWLPRGELALIPDCGHLPHVERPDLFVAALGRFSPERTLPG